VLGSVLGGSVLRGSAADADCAISSAEQAGCHIGYNYNVRSPGTPRDAPYGGKAREYAPEGRRFCGFLQNATKMVEAGKTPEAAKAEVHLTLYINLSKLISPINPFHHYWGPERFFSVAPNIECTCALYGRATFFPAYQGFLHI